MSLFSRRARAARLPLICVLAVLSARAVAVDAPRGTLTLARAIGAALENNPDLRASSYELQAAQARRAQAALRINPEVGIELENFAGSAAAAGTRALETTLTLGQVIELGGKRALRMGAGELDVEAHELEQRARELDLLADVSRRYLDVVVAQEHVQAAAGAAALTDATSADIERRVRAGRTPQAEASRARVAVARAAIELRQAEGNLAAARQSLAASWGASDVSFDAADARLFELAPVEPLEQLLVQLEQSNELAQFATLERQRDAELRLARAQARPNLSFSVGVRRFEETGDRALVAGFSMPIAAFDRNQGGIREARVRREQTAAARDAARVRAQATLRALYTELAAARSRTETLSLEAIPQAEQAVEQTRAGYARGRFSFLELASSQEELSGLRAARIDAAADYHRMLAEIERLTGVAIVRPAP